MQDIWCEIMHGICAKRCYFVCRKSVGRSAKMIAAVKEFAIMNLESVDAFMDTAVRVILFSVKVTDLHLISF